MTLTGISPEWSMKPESQGLRPRCQKVSMSGKREAGVSGPTSQISGNRNAAAEGSGTGTQG